MLWMKVTAMFVRIPGLQTERRKVIFTQAVSMFTAGLLFLFETTVKRLLYADKTTASAVNHDGILLSQPVRVQIPERGMSP